MKKFEVLYDFVDKAIKSRKYPENTGISLKTALKLFEGESNEQELNSVDEFRKNLDQIYQSVFTKNKKLSAGALATYKSRVLKVLNDYEKYGVDATKMANWSPKIIIRAKKQSVFVGDNEPKNLQSGNMGSSFNTFDFVGGIKLIVPRNAKLDKIVASGGLVKVYTEIESFVEKYLKEENLLESNNEN